MQPFKASKTQMVIRVGYQPNGSTENKLIYCIKDRNIKRVIQRGFIGNKFWQISVDASFSQGLFVIKITTKV